MQHKKVIRTFSFFSDVIKHSQKNPFITSFPEWCCQKYREEFMQEDIIKEKIIYYNNIIKNLKKELTKTKKKNKISIKLSNKEMAWIRYIAPYRIIHNKAEIKGVYHFFIGKFNINKNRITFKIFKRLYEEYKDDSDLVNRGKIIGKFSEDYFLRQKLKKK